MRAAEFISPRATDNTADEALPGLRRSAIVRHMATLTIQLEDDVARRVEESARREHKSVADWIRERVAALAAMEERAAANGYPTGWLSLFGSLAEDETFTAPTRGAMRPADE